MKKLFEEKSDRQFLFLFRILFAVNVALLDCLISSLQQSAIKQSSEVTYHDVVN